MLVVDDSAVIRQAINKMLRSEFDLVLAGDGESGWERLSADQRISVLITDIEMPKLDGYAFICRVRAAEDPRIRDMPIITITGAEDEETKARAYACGATDFITKPLNAAQLHARVQAYLGFDRNDDKSAIADDDVDELTRLYGRRAFIQHGNRLFPGDTPVALVHLAVDGFRRLYRQHGDDMADRLLVWIGRKLLGFAEQNTLLARIGGAEFAFLLPGAGRDGTLALCERIRQAFLQEKFSEGAVSVPLTVSLGVALPGPGLTDFDQLMQLAERRLRYAESKGGNQVGVSGLEELLSPEELVLAAPEDVASLSTAELEELAALVPDRAAPAPPSPGAIPAELISIDRALAWLAEQRGQDLVPYIDILVERLLPLLRLYARSRDLEDDVTLSALEARLKRRD
ncbi:MAG: GGDEF domain-containing response regulator [Acidiferrobacteraceae bacterium]